MKYSQLVLVEFRNTAPFVAKFTSDKPITIHDVLLYYIDKEDFNEERDGITFIDEPESIRL